MAMTRLFTLVVCSLTLMVISANAIIRKQQKNANNNNFLNKIVKRQAPILTGPSKSLGVFGGDQPDEPSDEDYSDVTASENLSHRTSSFPGSPTTYHSLSECEKCVEHAVCVYNRCECEAGYEGDPYFYCKNETYGYYCHSKADPAIRTLGEENYVVHVVGSTRLVQLTTERDSGGFCRFWLWGWTERVKGKQYFGGLSFRLDQEGPSGLVDVRRGHIKAEGKAGEPYNFDITYYGPGEPYEPTDRFEEQNENENGNGGPDFEQFVGYLIGGCDVENTQTAGSFMKFTIPCCGIEFAIRPFHEDHPDIIPGFWFQVAQDHYPSYETWDENEMHTEPMCLDHYRMMLVEDLVEGTGVTVGKREALSYHAMTNSLFTEQPKAPEGLVVTKILLRDCPYSTRDELLRAIRFFFNNPRFTKCLNGATGDSVETTIEGIQLATELMCYDQDDVCEPLATMVSRPECANVLRDFPEIRDHLVDPTECTGGIHNDFLDGNSPGGWWFEGEDSFK